MMKTVINYFINARPGPLCVMMVAPYLIYRFSPFGHNPSQLCILVLYFLCIALGWMYSIGMTANTRLPRNLKLPGILFNITMVVPFVNLLYVVIKVFIPLYHENMTHPPEWLIYLHFITIFCLGFNIWFAAKQFITFKLNRTANFIEYYPAFMSLWFGFIGVWYLQPKVQTVFERRENP